MSIPDDLILPKEVARLHKVHVSTVHRWIRAGRLRAYKRAGHRVVVSKAAALAVLQQVVPKSPAPRDAAAAAGQAAARLAGMGYRG